MMLKINWKLLLTIFFTIILLYSRLVNLSWGLPFPLHPDERNMAIAVQQLHCDSLNTECFNPHFFAYGQFPLYVSYFGIQIYRIFTGRISVPISFNEATLSLRLLSSFASIVVAWLMIKIIWLLVKKNEKYNTLFESCIYLLIIFSPGFIQFSHFGTTESLLMFFYTFLIYLSILFLKKKIKLNRYILLASVFNGLALATKISSVVYICLPISILIYFEHKKIWKIIPILGYFILSTSLFFILFSPHTIFSFDSFLNSMLYESSVALGNLKVFYTRQFENSIPVIFQFEKIYPYVLGIPVLILSLIGILFLSWRKKEINILRISFLIIFLSNTFMFTKWTRFSVLVIPVMMLFAILLFHHILMLIGSYASQKRLILLLFISLSIFCSIPGIAFLSIYQNEDIRFTASDWINKNIPSGSYILSEGGNVVDIPLYTQNNARTMFHLNSFDFYTLDEDVKLQNNLLHILNIANYIIIPSRRVFANHTCISPKISNINSQAVESTSNKCEMLKISYPLLNQYYDKLVSGNLGFKEVVELNSFPKICFLFNFGCIRFNDEKAEETFTVFDHPVIRIYKRM